jgi:hypothetical protein
VITTTESHNYPDQDLQEAVTRYRQATQTIARLRRRLARTITDLHNLIAAARATLAAQRDGESDPLYYLRDELHAQGHLSDADHQGGL